MLYGWPLVWLTDLEEPDRAALGLTSTTLSCDRLAYRCTVDTEDAEPWAVWSHGRVDPRRVMELTFGHAPAHWWVSQVPVAVRAIRATGP
jgi:hypothetical protein